MSLSIDTAEIPLKGREEVLNAAALAFMERGYAGTSIDDIANLAGATKGRVYHYWRSKSELFFDVIRMALEKTDAPVRAIFEQNLPPAEKLGLMAHAHVLAIIANFPAAKVGVQGIEKNLLSAGGVEEHRALRRVIRARDAYENMYKEVLAAGIRKGVFRDESPGLSSKAVLGALNWMTLWFDPNRNTSAEQAETIAGRLADFVVAGMRR